MEQHEGDGRNGPPSRSGDTGLGQPDAARHGDPGDPGDGGEPGDEGCGHDGGGYEDCGHEGCGHEDSGREDGGREVSGREDGGREVRELPRYGEVARMPGCFQPGDWFEPRPGDRPLDRWESDVPTTDSP